MVLGAGNILGTWRISLRFLRKDQTVQVEVPRALWGGLEVHHLLECFGVALDLWRLTVL